MEHKTKALPWPPLLALFSRDLCPLVDCSSSSAHSTLFLTRACSYGLVLPPASSPCSRQRKDKSKGQQCVGEVSASISECYLISNTSHSHFCLQLIGRPLSGREGRKYTFCLGHIAELYQEERRMFTQEAACSLCYR